MGEKFELPQAAIEAMVLVYDGGYVFDVTAANFLILVQLHYPEFINIGEPPKDFPMTRKPIFAAALTEKGKEYIDALQ